MALTRDVYRAFEDIVGSQNISEEPGVLDSYAYHYGAEATLGPGKKWLPRPEATILPDNTEEVQAIVKLCNRYKVKFKALSTGWGPWNAPGGPGVVQLDMRRMNRILEINEKDMYAVVEPYVISAQLQAELMKRGLTCNVIGAGPNTTALCAAKFIGFGWQGIRTSVEGRNLLGTEWVLPTGEILRLGSLGSGTGWFCGDGPGPSLRGALRGMIGAFGGNGVFTKAATKIYHWPGPQSPQVGGISPNYGLDPVPKYFKVWHFSFPTWKDVAEAGYKFGEADVAYIVGRYSPFEFLWDTATSTEEALRYMMEIAPQMKVAGYLIIIGANTQAEYDYCEKVMWQIIEETGGKSLPFVEDPNMQGGIMWRTIRGSCAARHVFRPTGSFRSCMGALEAIDLAVNQGIASNTIKAKHMKKGEIMNDGGDSAWGIVFEGGHFMHVEEPGYAHPGNEGQKGLAGYITECDEVAATAGGEFHCGGVPLGVAGNKKHNLFGPNLLNYHQWMRKLKKAMDPNNVSDSTQYISPEE